MTFAGASRLHQPPVFGSAWSWWTRPRAVSVGGVVYIGSTTRDGSVIVEEWTDDETVRKRHTISALEGEQDDHNNPALFLAEGQVPIVMYARHDKEKQLRYRRGTTPFVAGADLGEFDAEQTISTATGFSPGNCTYVIAHVHDGTIYAWTRAGEWGFTRSTDWGQTWSTPQAVFDSPFSLYMAARQVGDTLRVALTQHPKNSSPPDQAVYYAEVDLNTGSITANGSPLGNLDGTNLPIDFDDCDEVGDVAAGWGSWVYDVSPDGAAVLWSSFDRADVAATSEYHYSHLAGGTWTTHDIVAAGATFEGTTEPYLGGAQFAEDGTVILSRRDGADWVVERWTTADDGENWTSEELFSEAAGKLACVRAFEVEQIDEVARPFDVAVNWAKQFAAYTDWSGNVGGSRL